MPQETKTHGHEHQKIEGSQFRPRNFAELVDAIEMAFDYRGDVTLELKDGRTLEGYLFNRERDIAMPVIKLFPKGQTGELTIPYNDVAGIAFTGDDTAFGKSWDAWQKKNADQQKAEDAKARAKAASLGHL